MSRPAGSPAFRRRIRPFAVLLTALGLLLLSAPSEAAAPVDANASPGAKSSEEAEMLLRIEQVMWSRDPSAIPELREWAARSDAERVRERSIGALVLLGDRNAVAILQQRLARDASPGVRRAAAEAIGLLGANTPQSQLVASLRKDADPLVRAECARAVGRARTPGGEGTLLVALVSDPAPEVRALAAEALAVFRMPESVELLKSAAARDASVLVRIHAVRTLGAVAGREALPLYRETWETTNDPELRVEAFRQVVAFADPALWESRCLSTPDDPIRFLAFRSWLSRFPPANGPVRLGRKSEPVRRLEGFLSDRLKGIRELARKTLEAHGFKVKESGFVFVLEE